MATTGTSSCSTEFNQLCTNSSLLSLCKAWALWACQVGRVRPLGVSEIQEETNVSRQGLAACYLQSCCGPYLQHMRNYHLSNQSTCLVARTLQGVTARQAEWQHTVTHVTVSCHQASTYVNTCENQHMSQCDASAKGVFQGVQMQPASCCRLQCRCRICLCPLCLPMQSLPNN